MIDFLLPLDVADKAILIKLLAFELLIILFVLADKFLLATAAKDSSKLTVSILVVRFGTDTLIGFVALLRDCESVLLLGSSDPLGGCCVPDVVAAGDVAPAAWGSRADPGASDTEGAS